MSIYKNKIILCNSNGFRFFPVVPLGYGVQRTVCRRQSGTAAKHDSQQRKGKWSLLCVYCVPSHFSSFDFLLFCFLLFLLPVFVVALHRRAVDSIHISFRSYTFMSAHAYLNIHVLYAIQIIISLLGFFRSFIFSIFFFVEFLVLMPVCTRTHLCTNFFLFLFGLYVVFFLSSLLLLCPRIYRAHWGYLHGKSCTSIEDMCTFFDQRTARLCVCVRVTTTENRCDMGCSFDWCEINI